MTSGPLVPMMPVTWVDQKSFMLLVPQAYGILVGVGIQLLFILYSIARPRVDVEEKKVNIILTIG